MWIVGLGWGRASRVMTIREAARGDDAGLSIDALTIDTPGGEVDPDETHEDVREADELFDSAATARFVSFWIIGPSAGGGPLVSVLRARPVRRLIEPPTERTFDEKFN